MKIFREGMLKQTWQLVVTHIFSSVLFTLFGLGLMWWILDKPLLAKIYSAICAVIYFAAVYSSAYGAAEYDKKPYTPGEPYFFKGAVLSVGILLLNFILWLLCKFAWTYLTIDGSLATATAVIYNVLFVFDTFVYTGFINLTNGNMAWYGHLLLYLVPLLASFAGYIAGTRGFTLSDKLMPFIYEKRKSDMTK